MHVLSKCVDEAGRDRSRGEEEGVCLLLLPVKQGCHFLSGSIHITAQAVCMLGKCLLAAFMCCYEKVPLLDALACSVQGC